MLDLFRKKAQSPFLQGIVVVIALVFVFFGVGSYQKGGRNEVASVNGEPITLEQFKGAFQVEYETFKQRYGQEVPKSMLDDGTFRAQVLDRMVQALLLRQGALEMGIGVTDAEIQEKIKTLGAFNVGGIFNMERYRGTLASSRMSPSEFEASVRKDLLEKKAQDMLGRFVTVSPQEVVDRYSFSNDEVKLQYVSLSSGNYRDQVEVTDEALTQYFAENQEKYKTKRQVKARFISFNYEEIGKEIIIPPEEVEKYYIDNIETYEIEEKRQARHILQKVSSTALPETKAEKKKAAEDLLARVKKGDDFATLAKKHSDDGSAVKGGDLGFFTRGQMVSPFAKAVFSLGVGEISDVVETRFGYHIIKVEDIQPAYIKKLDEVKEDIINTLRADRAKSIAFEKANEVYKKIIMAGSMDAYAAENKTEIHETDFFTQTDPDPGLGGRKRLLRFVLKLKKGELSSLLEGSEEYAIVFLTDEKPPVVPELSEVRADVEKDYVDLVGKKLAADDVDVMLAALKTGASFADEAAKRSVEVQVTSFFSRVRRSSIAFPPEFISKGLGLTAENPYPDAPVKQRGINFVFGYVDRKDAALTELTDDRRRSIEASLLLEKQQLVLSGWLQGLKEIAEVSVNPDLI